MGWDYLRPKRSDWCLAAVLIGIVALLHFTNGQHYAQEAIAGHAKWATLAALEKQGVDVNAGKARSAKKRE